MQENCFLNQITQRKETNPIIIFATNVPLTEKLSNQSAPVKCSKKKQKNRRRPTFKATVQDQNKLYTGNI